MLLVWFCFQIKSLICRTEYCLANHNVLLFSFFFFVLLWDTHCHGWAPAVAFFTFSVIGSRESRVTIPSFGHLSLLKRDLAAGRAGLGPEWRFGQVSQIAVEKRNMFCYIFGKCPRGPTGSQGFPGVPEGSKKTNKIVVPYQLVCFCISLHKNRTQLLSLTSLV